MLATLFRVLAWLDGVYAVLVNVVAIVWVCTTLSDPWAQIVAWYSPLNFANWLHEMRPFAPALASYYVARWLSARR